MKVFVTGVCGQLGHDLMNELNRRGHEAVGSDIAEGYSGVQDGTEACTMPYVQLDITDGAEVSRKISDCKPDAVINCAAWTAVDAAEEETNREKVSLINGYAPKLIADVCKELNITMMQISTDYVFDGKGTTPWDPDCRDFKPLNHYGASKREGESAVEDVLSKYFIVRIAWVFGLNGNNFIKTMHRLGETHDELRVVNDQIGTPTYTFDLARLLVDMIETEKYGHYHVTNEGGYISWYDFAREIFRQAGMRTRVVPVTTAEYGLSKAMRPENSRLDKSKLVKEGFVPLPDWKDAVGRYLEQMKSNN